MSNETTVTVDEARAFIATHDAYGSVRLYGTLETGEIVAIKSEYYLNKYKCTRLYVVHNSGAYSWITKG